MRIVWIGADGYANCAMALLDAGHEISHLFRSGGSSSLAPVTIPDVAKRAGIRLRSGPVSRADIENAVAQGAEAIVSAVYTWRLPLYGQEPFPALNIHPSPLPEGRGPAPYEWAILTGRTETAVTIHQIVERFDAGPIVAQRPLAIRPAETTASLARRCSAAAEDLVVSLFSDFDRLWAERRPQGPGTYCKLPRRADRTLDWAGPAERLERQLRAFPAGARFGWVEGRLVRLGHVEAWPQDHEFSPGAVAARSGRRRLIATKEGFAEVQEATRPLAERGRLLAWPIVKRAKALVRR